MNRILYFCLVCLTLAGCADSKKGNDKNLPTVTVTIEPLRYFTEQIAGDKFNVVTMVPKGSSPETYEPTAQQMVDLANSELYIKVGNLGFERTWGKRLQANAQHLIVIDTSEGIHREVSGHRGETDPHTWLSPANALVIAQNIYKALALVDKKDSLYFKARLDRLSRSVMDIDIDIDKKLKSLPTRSFLIYHPALTYFAQDYKLTQIAIEEDGREPSAASLADVIDRARRDKVGIMLLQKEYNNRNTRIVTDATKADIREIDPLNYRWDMEMEHIAKTLAGQATTRK